MKKAPTKQQLYERIAALERINQKQEEERTREQVRRWNELLPRAYERCRSELNRVFPNLIKNLHFEHVDAGGYWFTFELENDDRKQTYAVRHSDMD